MGFILSENASAHVALKGFIYVSDQTQNGETY